MTILNLSLAALSLAAVSSAVVLPRNDTGSKGSLVQKRPVQGSGVLKVPVTKQTSTGITKRQDFDPLQNIYNGYLIGLEIGTPLQSLQVQIDTGSYELWVDPDCANGNDPTYCETFNVYYPGNSSTASDEGESFDLLYGTGEATGEYLIDDIVIGSGSIPQTQFGWATWSTFVNAGLMGIGLGYPWNLDYYGVIDQLYVYGVTASRAFSLDLASIDVADGSIIFGGIDTMKYIGSLYTAPMIDGPDSPDGSWRYWIYMSYVGVTLPNTTTSIPCTTSTYEQGMFPDSGATLSQFPPNLFNAVIGHFPSAVQQSDGSYTVDCALRNQAGTIDFGFGTKMIHVNFYDWLWAANGLCYFGAQPNPDTFSLGDSFIRSAYLVYDQDNFNIHIAQAANCGSNIVAIGSGANAVPSITGGCTASSTSIVSTSTSVVKTSTSSVKTSSSAKSTSSLALTGVSASSTLKSSTTSVKSTSSSSSSAVKATSSSTLSLSSSSTSLKSTSSSKSSASSTSSTSVKLTSSTLSFSSSTSLKTTSSTLSSSSSGSLKTTSSSSLSSLKSTSSGLSSSSTKSSSSSSSSKLSSVSTASSSLSTSKSSTSSKLSSTSSTSCLKTTTSGTPTVTLYVTVTASASATHGTCTSIGQTF